MKSSVVLIAIAVFLAIVLGIVFVVKHPKSNNNQGPTGSNTPVCSVLGQSCDTGCCDGLTCKNGICINKQLFPSIPAFFLLDGNNNNYGIHPGSSNIVPIDESPVWTTEKVPSQFWFWDGQGNLVVRAPEVNAGGAVIGMIESYISPTAVKDKYVTTQNLPTLGGINITENGAIYSSDYNLCIFPETGTNNLIWKECLGIPYTFKFIKPSSCSNTACSESMPCCPPYNSCSAGTCSTCFGDPIKSCPDPSTIAVCGESGIFTCKNKCDPLIKTCDEAQTGTCEFNGTDYEWRCNWKCGSSGNIDCGSTNVPTCTGSDSSGWEWKCPIDPCTLPKPKFSPENNPIAGYTWNNSGYYESTPGTPWKYPNWNCKEQEWDFIPGCDQSYKQNCPFPSKAICSPDTSFNWQCVDPNSSPDLCGFSTGNCGPDAVCMDISTCTGGDTENANDWTWVCPSQLTTIGSLTDRCKLIKIYDWSYPPISLDGAPNGIVTNQGNTPVFPTILNEQCRGNLATELNHPTSRGIIDNPIGSILGQGTQSNPYTLYTGTTGDRDHIITKHSAGSGVSWNCISSNPCNHGTFVPSSTGDLEIIPPSGVVTPPDDGELLKHGTCSCDAHFGGQLCNIGEEVCNGHGTIEQCNTDGGKCILPEGYFCNCLGMYAGKHCQFDSSSCGLNNGVPDMNSDTLQCSCYPNFTGTYCDKCDVTAPSPAVNNFIDNGSYVIQAYGMTQSFNKGDNPNNFPCYLMGGIIGFIYSISGCQPERYPTTGCMTYNGDPLTLFTALSNSDKTFDVASSIYHRKDPNYSLVNVTIDPCGFIRNGLSYVSLDTDSIGKFSTTSTVTGVKLINVNSVGLGCLFASTYSSTWSEYCQQFPSNCPSNVPSIPNQPA